MDVIQILKDLIAIPSVNPMQTGTGQPVEREVADYVESFLRRQGIDCERQAVLEGRENVIAILHPSPASSQTHIDGLMLNSHMDTVPVAHMEIDPFDPVLRQGRIYGRGACDAKGSIAVMLAALSMHSSRSFRPSPIVFAATVDEEFSFSGSWKLIERSWPVSAAIVGEPTRLASVIAHKGIARWHVRVWGVSAHAATPGLGRSAIYDGARVALALEEYASQLALRRGHPLLGSPTLNVGKVTGGQAVNMVPDLCEFEIDRRLLPGEDGLEAVQDCQDWLRQKIGDKIQFEVQPPCLVDPALETRRESRIVQAVEQSHISATGVPNLCQGAHYGTDGSKLARAGIETVVCGPGNIVQAHTNSEYVEVNQLEQAIRLYDDLIQRWGTEENLWDTDACR